ncbi:MAG: hypothetical protein ACTSRA_21790, partial [Promethearchaeota archaeon]
PLFTGIFMYATFEIIAAHLFPELSLFVAKIFVSAILGEYLSVFIFSIKSKKTRAKNEETTKDNARDLTLASIKNVLMKKLDFLFTAGTGFFGTSIFMITIGIIFWIGGPFIIVASIFIDVVIISSFLLGLIWNTIILLRNIKESSISSKILILIFSVVFFIGVLYLLTLPEGLIQTVNNISENLF